MAAWQQHAKTNGCKLSMVLIPPPALLGVSDLYKVLREHLEEAGLEVLDLAHELARRRLGQHDVYWRYDGHFSPAGNRIAADAIASRWGK